MASDVNIKLPKEVFGGQDGYFKHYHNPSWKELSYLQKKHKGEFLLVTVNGKINNLQDFSKLNNMHVILFYSGRKKNQQTINSVVKYYERFFREFYEVGYLRTNLYRL